MVRIISQQTYDEVVNENIKEFDMSPEEAIKEAIAQFEAQGVDLTNIIKDSPLANGDENVITKTITNLKKFAAIDNLELVNHDDLTRELNALKNECDKELAHRLKAAKDGAYPVLIDITNNQRCNNNKGVLLLSTSTLLSLMNGQPDLLDDKGVNLLFDLMNKESDTEVVAAALDLVAAACYKHEKNRCRFFDEDIIAIFKRLLVLTDKKEILTKTLQVMRKLTLDDDIRVEFGKAHEIAKEMGFCLINSLVGLLKENTKPPLVSEIVMTLAALLVRNELCTLFAENGTELLFHIFAENMDNMGVVLQTYTLVTALAGNDQVKREMVKKGIIPIIVPLVYKYSNNAKVSAAALKCVSALTLREPSHGEQFLDADVAEAIVQCMNIHSDDFKVQRNGCWAIRNIVARYRDQNHKFRDIGTLEVLNSAYDKFSDQFGYDIKSAMRDLEYDVKFEEQWTGKGAQIENE